MANTPNFGAGFTPEKVWTNGKTGSYRGVPVYGGYVNSVNVPSYMDVGSPEYEQYLRSSGGDVWNEYSKYKSANETRYNSPYGQAERAYTGSTTNQQNTLNSLQSLLRDPSKIQQTAGYKFALDQGNQAINRSAAAKGMLGSGNVLAELAKYGQGMASNEFQNQAGNLSNLANGYGNQAGQAGQFLLGADKTRQAPSIPGQWLGTKYVQQTQPSYY